MRHINPDDRELTLHQGRAYKDCPCLFCGTREADRWYWTFTIEQHRAFDAIQSLVEEFRAHGYCQASDDIGTPLWDAMSRLDDLLDPLGNEYGSEDWENICGGCVDNRGNLDERIAANTYWEYPQAADFRQRWARRHASCALDVHEYREDPFSTERGPSKCPGCVAEREHRKMTRKAQVVA